MSLPVLAALNRPLTFKKYTGMVQPLGQCPKRLHQHRKGPRHPDCAPHRKALYFLPNHTSVMGRSEHHHMTNFTEISFERPGRARAVEVLSERGWLAGRPPAVRDAILSAGRLVKYDPGAVLYNVGDRPEGLYGLVSGVVQLHIPSEYGETITVHRAEPGFWIGDLALFSEQTRLVGVSARGTAWVFFVPSVRLRRLVQERPETIADFYALTHQNMQTALRLIANLSVTQSHRRVALRLLHYAELSDHPEGWLELSQEELATLTAVSLPTLQRCLRRLSDDGCIEVGYGRIRIRDRDALMRFVEA